MSDSSAPSSTLPTLSALKPTTSTKSLKDPISASEVAPSTVVVIETATSSPTGAEIPVATGSGSRTSFQLPWLFALGGTVAIGLSL